MSFEKFTSAISNLKAGDPMDPICWPLCSEEALKDLLDQVNRFKKQVL
jgi:hypothetical protein